MFGARLAPTEMFKPFLAELEQFAIFIETFQFRSGDHMADDGTDHIAIGKNLLDQQALMRRRRKT